MSRVIKILSAFILVVIFTLNSSIVCMGYDVINGYANVPSVVEKGKGFTVNLQAQCNTSVGVVMFTVIYDDGIKYKSCSVNDGSSGYIEKSYSDNKLTVMYVNTKGISVIDKTNLVDIKFEADDYANTVDIQIFTSNSASSDELVLESGLGKLYSIEITEKATDNKPAQSKDINSDKPEKATNSTQSVADNKPIPTQQSSETLSNNANIDKRVLTVEKPNDIGLFFAGGVFAVAVVLLVFMGYKSGKKKADSKNEK